MKLSLLLLIYTFELLNIQATPIQLETFRLNDNYFNKEENDNLIAIKSKANNKYVCAENNGLSYLIADRNSVNTWEIFRLIELMDARVVLQSLSNKKFVSVDHFGGLIANKLDADPSCLFTILEQGSDDDDGAFVIKSALNGRFVCIDHTKRLRTMFDHDHDGKSEFEAYYIEKVVKQQYNEPHTFTWLG